MFVYFTGVKPGNYSFAISYRGTTPRYIETVETYPAACMGIDTITSGNWGGIEIVLESSKSYSDPFQDVELSATFTGLGGEILTRPAFWDSGTTWKIRFAPTLVGIWSYSTTCSDTTNTSLHLQTGRVQTEIYNGNLPIYKNGFLKVSSNKRYMVYNDDTPFFWLGDTHWQMSDYERDSECNYGDNCGSQF